MEDLHHNQRAHLVFQSGNLCCVYLIVSHPRNLATVVGYLYFHTNTSYHFLSIVSEAKHVRGIPKAQGLYSNGLPERPSNRDAAREPSCSVSGLQHTGKQAKKVTCMLRKISCASIAKIPHYNNSKVRNGQEAVAAWIDTLPS